MRIIAGEAKGRTLFAPKGSNTRPTADRVREAIFSSLADRVQGANVLDAFAGSGALGLEAMSRGANSALLMEIDREAAKVAERNMQLLGFEQCRLQRGDCQKLLKRLPAGSSFDIIFADPPYNRGLVLPLLQQLKDLHLLAENGILVVESSSKKSEVDPQQLPPGWQIIRTATYGDTAVHYCCLTI